VWDVCTLSRMDMVGVRELSHRVSALLDQMQQDRRPVVITKHGRPIAVLSPIDEDAFYDFVLEHAPEFVASRKAVEDNLDV
jgi:prevent-host-death family protein